jgi:hypothetical protein
LRGGTASQQHRDEGNLQNTARIEHNHPL